MNFRLSLLIISWTLARKATNNLENRLDCAGGEAALHLRGSLEEVHQIKNLNESGRFLQVTTAEE